jgi:hypothetical protein
MFELPDVLMLARIQFAFTVSSISSSWPSPWKDDLHAVGMAIGLASEAIPQDGARSFS